MYEATVPTRHTLQSALLVCHLVDPAGSLRTDLRNSYGRIPNGGLFGQDDLIRGEALLLRVGLLVERESKLHPSSDCRTVCSLESNEGERLVAWKALSVDPPVWLHTAVTGDGVYPELIPDEDWDALGQSLSPEEREAFLLSLGLRHDPEQLPDRGHRGEEAVLEACRAELIAMGRQDLVPLVQRVSQVSDQLGYDVVTPTSTGATRRLEVKTTQTGPQVYRAFLSRNEARVGLADPSWRLVVCHWNGETATPVGWCGIEELSGLLPSDAGPWGRWASAELLIRAERLRPGVPVAQELPTFLEPL